MVQADGDLDMVSLSVIYSGHQDLSIGVGQIKEVSQSIIIHSASVLGGQSGGPLILLKDLEDFDPSDPHAKIPFIGIQIMGTDHGLQLATNVANPSFLVHLAELEGLTFPNGNGNGNGIGQGTKHPRPFTTVKEMKKNLEEFKLKNSQGGRNGNPGQG